MLYAAIIVCSLSMAPDCLYIEDDRGPYEGFEQCDRRNQELLRHFWDRFAPMSFALFCEEDKPDAQERRRVQVALLWQLHRDYPDVVPEPIVPEPEDVDTRSSGVDV